jgi:hypothetical protein
MRICILSLLLAVFAFSPAWGADITAQLSPGQARIGDPLALEIHVSGAGNQPVQLGALPESFDLVSADSSQRRNGVLRYTIMATDTGQFALSDLKLQIGTETVAVPPVSVWIQSVVPDSAQAPKPLKPYREHPFRWRDLLEYKWIALVLALVALVIWVWQRFFNKQPQHAAVLEMLLPPHEEALRNLIILRDQKYPERGMLKEFFSEFSQILRRYIERRYEFPALEMTTFDLEYEFADSHYPQILRTRLLPSLREADLVKFAKHVPDFRMCEAVLDLGFEIVELTKTVPAPATQAVGEKAA